MWEQAIVHHEEITIFIGGVDHSQMRGLLVGGWATPLKNMKVNWDD